MCGCEGRQERGHKDDKKEKRENQGTEKSINEILGKGGVRTVSLISLTGKMRETCASLIPDGSYLSDLGE